MSSMCIIGSDTHRRMTLLQAIAPDMLSYYNSTQDTVALVHFVKSGITKMSMYDMLEHELYPWSVDYETLETDYHDNLQFCMNFWKKNKSTPTDLNLEDIIIWVGFRANPGYWYGKGDAHTGFVSDGILPYDENENFILDSHPEQRTTPNWVLEFINEQMVYR